MANLDQIAMRSVRKLADLLGSHDRRLARLETAQDARRTSLDDGEVIELRGQSGKVVGTFGKNPDGTYATVPFDGPAPRRLIEPTVDSEGVVDAGEVGVVSDAPGTITAKFSPKQVLPSDFAGVDFFYTSGEDRVLLGSVTSLTGGAKTVAVKPGAYEVVAQMRSIPGKTTPLDRKFPVTVAAPVDVKEFDNAKAKLSTAQSQIDALLASPPSAGVSVSATPPSDPKNGDMWLHPVTDDMGNTVHVLQVFQAGAWVTVEDQDAKQIAAGAKASADAATQTANLAKTTAEQAANGTVDVTRLAADSNSTVKESVVGKMWDVIRAKLVAAKQIITEDMLATGSVTASKITASEELSAKAAKFLRITADQIEAGTLNAKVKIGTEGQIIAGVQTDQSTTVTKTGVVTRDVAKGNDISLSAQTGLRLASNQGYYLDTNAKEGQYDSPTQSGIIEFWARKNATEPARFAGSVEPSPEVTYTFPPGKTEEDLLSGNITNEDMIPHLHIEGLRMAVAHDDELGAGYYTFGYREFMAGCSDSHDDALDMSFDQYQNLTDKAGNQRQLHFYASPYCPVDGRVNGAIAHGANPDIPRPQARFVTWIGQVEPKHMNPAVDIWIEPQTTPDWSN